jgi:hypothetical protein
MWMRTWIGPAYRAEGVVGNPITRRYRNETGTKVEQLQHAEEVIPDGVVEIRVHGVNGGTPEHNLHDPTPIRVSGDDTAGFYRRRHGLSTGPGRIVEAYNWSAINSRKSIRAWWLILFPFAAANFAGWLLPKGMPKPFRTAAQIIVRLVGMCVTMLAVLGIALVFVDLIGLQCGRTSACTTGLAWSWVGTVRDWSVVGTDPTHLALTYSLFPALAILALWLLGRRSSRAYENYGAGRPATNEATGPRIDDIRMDRVEFWQAPDVVYVQAWLHATGGLSILTAAAAFIIREVAPGSQHYDTLKVLGVAALVVAGLAALAEVGISRMHQIPTRWLRKRNANFLIPRWSWIPAGTAIGLYAAVFWLGWISDPAATPDQPPLEAIRNSLIWVAVIAIALVLVLALVVGAWRSVILAVGAGVALFGAIVQNGNGYRITWLTGFQWLFIELALATGGIARYLWVARDTPPRPNPADHNKNPVWIYGSTAFIVVLGAGSYVRVHNVWLQITACAIPGLYLGAQFAIQIWNGHDYPGKEEMREGQAAILAGLGVTSALTAISAGAVFVAGRLGTSMALPRSVAGGPSDACPTGVICYPAEIGWYSLTALAGVIVLVVGVALRALLLPRLRWRLARRPCCEYYDNQQVPDRAYDDAGSCSEHGHDGDRQAFAKHAISARWQANITDDADWLIGGGVMTTLTLLVAAAVARLDGNLPTETGDALFSWAAGAVALIAVGAGVLIYTARDNQQIRETMGILWDVMSFFPRRFHPLAPPCYAERAVLDVRNRIIYTTTRGTEATSIPDSYVIVVAHSEGTLITTAALLSLLQDDGSAARPDVTAHPGHPQPTGEELDRVAFVTYGCMLARLYGRAWPDQLPEDRLRALKRRLERPDPSAPSDPSEYVHPASDRIPRWINFGRYSDYLGGRVFQELQRKPTHRLAEPDGDQRSDDVFFVDPTRRWRWYGQLEHARIWRHSFDYESDQEDPRFREHVWAIARVFREENEADVLGDYPWMTASRRAPTGGSPPATTTAPDASESSHRP